MSPIKPTVGRVVWFYVYVAGQGHKGPLAGHVCQVHSDDCVNLMVINESGVPRSETSVKLVQSNEPPPNHDYCGWMPYQTGQAAKTEAAEKALADAKAAA